MDNLSPEQIQAMIAMLQSMLGSQQQKDNEQIDDAAESDNRSFETKKTKPKRKTATKNKTNKFDSMPEIHMHKDDIAIDKKLRTQPPVPRARPFSMIQAVCRVCGRKEDVNPSLLAEGPGRYKCNKCSTSAG